MVGAGAAGDQRVVAAARPRLSDARDQLLRLRPAEAHAALRGVHRFGDAEAEVPEPVAEGERRVPVDRGRQPRIVVGERIGDDVRRGIGDAREVAARRASRTGSACRLRRYAVIDAVGVGEVDVGHFRSPAPARRASGAPPSSAARARRAARPWRRPRARRARARPRRRGAGTSPTAP